MQLLIWPSHMYRRSGLNCLEFGLLARLVLTASLRSVGPWFVKFVHLLRGVQIQCRIPKSKQAHGMLNRTLHTGGITSLHMLYIYHHLALFYLTVTGYNTTPTYVQSRS